ncbi:hypothetical protein [Kistimonas asteriae]|uniref:hypothetical protein n=1 Tax=Kistimonas asteriae TaxID=517724 RepID=UPI001BABCEBC|nr:hypothetical protein [Kistimonas asteriae]
MSLFGRLLGSKKAVDGIYKGVDALVYTDEEKANYYLRLLKAYEPFKVAQRLTALMVGIPFVLIWILCALMIAISAFLEPCSTDQVCRASILPMRAKELATLNNETLGTPFALIVTFYFAGGAVEGALRAKVGK